MIDSPTDAAQPARTNVTRWCTYGIAGFCVVLCVIAGPYNALRHDLSFDDAFIYLRYAANIRRGLGVAWNPDGMATYGLTSQIWAFVLVPFAKLGGRALQLASWLTGVAALAVMAFAVAGRSRYPILRNPAAAFVVVALPLLLNGRFTYQMTTGMDTMLSLLANAVVVLGILHYLAAPNLRRALLLGFIGFCAVLARPENLVCAVASPVIAACAERGRPNWRTLGAFLLAFAILYGMDLLVCLEYFGVFRPLSVLVDHSNTYTGFVTGENGLEYAFAAMACMLPFLGVLVASGRYSDGRLNFALLLPAAVTMGYLITQRQHMGFQGRYFVPFLPYVIVPAVLALDRACTQNVRRAVGGAAVGIVVAIGAYVLSLPLQHSLVHRQVASTASGAVAVPALRVASRDPLPGTDWSTTIVTVAKLVSSLSPGVVVAAPEVGILGYASQDKTIIDLVGLNDNDIARHGFSMERLLARAPDIIWFPPPDYTGLRAAIFSEPRLFRDYSVIADAFNYGIAVRRDSPYRKEIDAAIGQAWALLYPQRELQEYSVTAAEAMH